ncbi:MAG: hypothetical protein WCW84_10085 [Sulfurimonas sp.]|jgi:hypothetical protein
MIKSNKKVESAHQKLKKQVLMSFMWAMSEQMRRSMILNKVGILKTIVSIGCINSIVKITLAEYKKSKNQNVAEAIKIATWEEMTGRYTQEVMADIPSLLETLFYENFEWMSKIKFLQYNIEIMALNVINKNVDPKVSRQVANDYMDVLSHQVYQYFKEEKEMVA